MKYHYDEFNRNEFESHMLAYNLIDSNTKVLDIGCATGYMARELSHKKCEIVGVDYDKKALQKAGKYCKKTVLCNLEEVTSLPLTKNSFDYVIMLDVLEHLSHPENVFKTIKQYLKKDGFVIISVPNIAHASIRWGLLKGEFNYTYTGILDQTHVHFYTKESLEKKLKESGLTILKLVPTNGMCKVPFLYKITDRLPVSWQYRIAKLDPSLFGFQFIVKASVS